MPSTRIDQVLASPGAMRQVLSTSGKASVPLPTCPVIVALSQVSQGTRAPVASGRVRTRLTRLAWTVSGRQPSRSGMWQTCMPRSPMQP
jgi:hypothetical protein